jgi:hypothetical protein
MGRGVQGKIWSDEWQPIRGSHPQVFESSPAILSGVSVIDKTTCGSLIHLMRDFRVLTLRRPAQRDPTGWKRITYWWQYQKHPQALPMLRVSGLL